MYRPAHLANLPIAELKVIGWVSASDGSCADCTDMGVARAGLTACIAIGFVSPILGFFGAGLRIGGDISFAGVAKGFGHALQLLFRIEIVFLDRRYLSS